MKKIFLYIKEFIRKLYLDLFFCAAHHLVCVHRSAQGKGKGGIPLQGATKRKKFGHKKQLT